VFACVRIYMCVFKHFAGGSSHGPEQSVCMYVCLCVWGGGRARVHVCVYVCMCVRVYLFVRVYLCLCVYTLLEAPGMAPKVVCVCVYVCV